MNDCGELGIGTASEEMTFKVVVSGAMQTLAVACGREHSMIVEYETLQEDLKLQPLPLSSSPASAPRTT
jgi:hypothetical protein